MAAIAHLRVGALPFRMYVCNCLSLVACLNMSESMRMRSRETCVGTGCAKRGRSKERLSMKERRQQRIASKKN